MSSRSNWNLQVLDFEHRGNLEYLDKNLSDQGENQQLTQPTDGRLSINLLQQSRWIFWSIKKGLQHSLERIVSHQLQVVNLLTYKAGQRRKEPPIDHLVEEVPAFKFVLKKFLQH